MKLDLPTLRKRRIKQQARKLNLLNSEDKTELVMIQNRMPFFSLATLCALRLDSTS